MRRARISVGARERESNKISKTGNEKREKKAESKLKLVKYRTYTKAQKKVERLFPHFICAVGFLIGMGGGNK